MDRYNVTLEGLTPLLMHQDNLGFSEKIKAWQRNPANKEFSVAGDDRSPPWTWLGYIYHDRRVLGVPSDNLMTCIREGGCQVKTGRQGKASETYKKHTQSGIVIDQEQWPITINGKTISVQPLEKLINEMDFTAHLETAERLGFELLVKRAKIGTKKHVRVRPLFRNWLVSGSMTVIDAELSSITMEVLQTIWNQAGALAGLCDWRVSSPKSSGSFGKFIAHMERA